MTFFLYRIETITIPYYICMGNDPPKFRYEDTSLPSHTLLQLSIKPLCWHGISDIFIFNKSQVEVV